MNEMVKPSERSRTGTVRMAVLAAALWAAAGQALGAGSAARDSASPRRNAVYGQGRWLLALERDRFTGLVACTLRARDGRMRYRPGAVGFRFGHDRDTTNAWYRVDDGPPRRWRDDYPALIGAGVEIDGPGLSNPTGGIVWAPVAVVVGAAMVRVRPEGFGNGRVFRMDGFADLLAAAPRLGCRFA